MKPILRILSSVAAWTLLCAAGPAPTVEKVLDFYKTDEFLGDSFKYVQEAIDRRKKDVTIDPALIKRINDLGPRIYTKKNLLDVFKIAYAKNTTMESMTSLYAWQNTPNGLMLRKAYAEHFKGNAASWKKYYDKESPKVLKPNRRNALTTFITSTEQWELYTTKVLGGDFTIWHVLNTIAPANAKETIKSFKEKLKPRKSGFIEPGKEWFLVFDFALLRDVKNEEIDEMSKFPLTVPGQASTKAYRFALEQTFESAAKTLANEIVKGTK